jgi:hypothetical protein
MKALIDLAKSRKAFYKDISKRNKDLHSGINSIIDNYLAEKYRQEG